MFLADNLSDDPAQGTLRFDQFKVRSSAAMKIIQIPFTARGKGWHVLQDKECGTDLNEVDMFAKGQPHG